MTLTLLAVFTKSVEMLDIPFEQMFQLLFLCFSHFSEASISKGLLKIPYAGKRIQRKKYLICFQGANVQTLYHQKACPKLKVWLLKETCKQQPKAKISQLAKTIVHQLKDSNMKVSINAKKSYVLFQPKHMILFCLHKIIYHQNKSKHPTNGKGRPIAKSSHAS